MLKAAEISPGPTLSRRLLGAASWVVLGAGVTHVARLVGNLIMTRLLAPEAFGLVAVASMVPTILSLLSDVGFRENICRNPKGEDQRFLDTVWSIQIVRGQVLWLGCTLVAGLLYVAAQAGWIPRASTYGDPRMPWVLAVCALGISLGSFHSTKIFSENRKLRIKQVLMIELTTQLLGIVAMIAIAALTRSIWAILIGSLIGTVSYTILTHTRLSGVNNRWCWDREHVADIMGFGKWIAWSSAFTVFASNGDKLLLGGFASAQAMGLYSIAATLIGSAESLVGQVMGRVALPGLSEVARTAPERVPGAYFKLRSRFDPTMLAISGLLFAAGDVVVRVMYDPRYQDAGHMLQILALGLIASRYTIALYLYIAMGRPKYSVVLNFVRCVSLYAIVGIGYLAYGIPGAVLGIAMREVPAVFVVWYFNSKHQLNNVALELRLLLFWPAGFVVGEIVSIIYARLVH